MTDAITRRAFLLNSALATAGVSLHGFSESTSAATINGAMPALDSAAAHPLAVSGTEYFFLSREEAAFVEAAVARLIPADALGPGALEAGCAIFIDRQLAGDYGRGARWYMQGPWPEGVEQQGSQSRLSPAETYRAAIAAVDAACHEHRGGRAFRALSYNEQDQVLTQLEKGELELPGVKAKTFFALLLQNTVEGFFADPLYGGNRDMVGWKLIGFPGARYDHRAMVGKHGAPYSLPPVGILGRKAWS